MVTSNAEKQIIRENFARLKYVTLLFVGYSAFAGIIVVFVGGMLAFGRPNEATVPMLFMLIPLTWDKFR